MAMHRPTCCRALAARKTASMGSGTCSRALSARGRGPPTEVPGGGAEAALGDRARGSGGPRHWEGEESL
eukprot:2023397-Lingulodinium_polyedra.AAC.1